MKVYIVADLEGVSGVGGFDLFGDERPGEVEKKRRAVSLWTGDINAAIGGALSGGATEIFVLDNHGSGESLALAEIHPPARLIHGRGRPTWLPLLDSSVDALLMVGHHARVGNQGAHLSHTYSRQRLKRVRLNGRDIGEIGLIAGIAGAHGVPAVFLSGDDAAVAEGQEWIPGIESATVKRSLSRQTCLSLPCEEARDLIGSGVERGLKKKSEIAPTVLSPPLELVVEYRFKDSWRALGRRCLFPTSGMRMAGWGGMKMVDQSLPKLWDRFIGLA